MDKLTILFIRACKSTDHEVRLRSVYRRFFLSGACEEVIWGCIASRLAEICDKHFVDNASYLANELMPSNAWKYEGENKNNHYNKRVALMLSSRIRFTNVDRFPVLKQTARYRRLFAKYEGKEVAHDKV